MKIISRPGVWTARCTCRECGAVLEIEESDLRYDPGQDYPVTWPVCYYVTCGHCTRTIKFLLNSQFAERIPTFIRARVRERAGR